MRLSINIHERSYPRRDGVAQMGDVILQWDIENVDAAPRVGELLTMHPGGAPDEDSLTARVTGIQHVFLRSPLGNWLQTVAITAMEEA